MDSLNILYLKYISQFSTSKRKETPGMEIYIFIIYVQEYDKKNWAGINFTRRTEPRAQCFLSTMTWSLKYVKITNFYHLKLAEDRI